MTIVWLLPIQSHDRTYVASLFSAGSVRGVSTEGAAGHGNIGDSGPRAVQSQLQPEIRQDKDQAVVSSCSLI